MSDGVLFHGRVYLGISDLVRCRDGTAVLSRTDGSLSAEMAGRRLTMWPWKTPIALVGGLHLLDLPSDPWIWQNTELYLRPRVVEQWTGEALGIRADPARLELHLPHATTYQTDLPRPARSNGLRILIDPGHGGEDLGAVSPRGIPEKRNALSVGLHVGAMLTELGYEVKLTRVDDSYPTLSERVQMANRWDADLMLSLHFNAASRKGAKGIETYILSREATDPRAQKLARFEHTYEMPDTNPSELVGSVLEDVARGAQENANIRLASAFHEAMVDRVDANDRGVRKAPFFVLAGTTMPAFLLELGYMSNREEAQRVRKPSYQRTLARAVAQGVDTIAPYLKLRAGKPRNEPKKGPTDELDAHLVGDPQ